MSSENQIIVELDPTSTGGALGERDESKIKASFVGSPTFEGSYSIDNDIRRMYLQDVLTTSDVDGYGFSDFNTNYLDNGAPDLSTCVEAGADNSGGPQLGKAKSPDYADGKPWPVPNPMSPRAGTGGGATWMSQPAPTVDVKIVQPNINYGSGPIGPESPSDTSGAIARQVPWTLTLGSST
tara:strand:+ start:265 stop:807 length:543 start_codon:yes stop_codon:yes gene_type:complete